MMTYALSGLCRVCGFSLLTLLTACNSDYQLLQPENSGLNEPETEGAVNVTIWAERDLSARIRRTDFGVPHIEAASLEEVAFGSGYAQAEDHLCLIADGIIKANSERSKYFGPHQAIDFTTGAVLAADNQNLISDFGYKALNIRASAEQNIAQLPARSTALLSGFVAGYNLYLSELDRNLTPNLPCAGQAWVQPIDATDMLTYLFSIALLPGAANFLDLIFYANPGDVDEYLPTVASLDEALTAQAQQPLADIYHKAQQRRQQLQLPEPNPLELGSNGWGIGKDLSANGKGIVLANPHFPHVGNLRFWQSHLTIPGELNVAGGSLIGTPGIINIGFNQHLAWTHTFSTAEHFIVYQLALAEEDRLQYQFDDALLAITEETVTIDVKVAEGIIVPMQKTVYRTERGVLIETPPELAPFGWNDEQAFMLQDANMNNMDVLEHWLAINLSASLAEFQQAFKDYDGVIFNNTMYADDQGNAFYIDDSTVPHLTETAQQALQLVPELRQSRAQAGFTVLPGDRSDFAFSEAVPYEQAPQLLRTDFVQNANNSYWLTNPAAPIEWVSPLYGPRRTEQSLRTRMGLTMLDPISGGTAGADGLYDVAEVEGALLNNRAYLAELALPELLTQCQQQGSTLVDLGEGTQVSIVAACDALAQWNGAQNRDSIGGALLREWAHRFDTKTQLVVPFSTLAPYTTPNTLHSDGRALVLLAQAAQTLLDAGFELDAPLGELQFIEKSLADGSASGQKISVSGSNNYEGGFNVFAYSTATQTQPLDDTLLPQHGYAAARDPLTGEATASRLSQEGYHIRYGSNWMMVVGFNENGPQARGLLVASQSNNPQSPHWNDQTQYYAAEQQLRPLNFTETEITAATLTDITIELSR